MKVIFEIFLILFIWGYLTSLSLAQNDSNNVKLLTTKEVSSILNGARINKDSDMIKLKELDKFAQTHKNDNDSAWINDFNGHKTWDSKTKSLDGKPLTITDSLTNNYYILDSTHIIITAYNKSNQIIWKTDPHKDNSIPDYRHNNPTITYFKIGELSMGWKDLYKKDERVIFIHYSNSQSGFLDMKTGKFIFLKQN